MSTSAEEAMARAKEIAARLAGSSAPASADTDASSSSSKRKRWGITPESGDSTAAGDNKELLPGLSDVAKKLKAGTEPAQRRVWIDTSRKPNAHFVAFVNDGDRLKAILSQMSSSDKLSILLKGRGTNPNPIPGMPEEPIHVLIEGPPDLVAEAEPLVDKMLSDADTAPLQVADPSSIAEKAIDALASVMSTPGGDDPAGSHTQGYRPAPVAALIHGNVAGAGPYGPAGGETLEEQIGVPNGVVGYIIGRGGENISSMQARSGCKIQIQKEHEMAPGQTQRVITLTSSSTESIDQCRGMIEEMVAERIRATGSSVSMASAMATPGVGGSQTTRLQEAITSGHQLLTMVVPDGEVGLIIGRAGATIKSIQDRSGANIQIPQAADSNNSAVRTVSITHPHMEGAQMAKQIIDDILASKVGRPSQVPHTTIEVQIPDQDVGMCIGRSGCVIREMQNKSGTKIQIPSMSMPGSVFRIATVTGPAEGCNQVKQMIERISLEQSSQSVMAGTVFTNQSTGYGGGQYTQQSHGQYGGAGQKDYSAEWAAYYAAQGGSQSGVVTGSTAAPAPAASGTPNGAQQGADAYYEQFFRYAYYYGEDAARKYYGAWSPLEGTPNPYGTNPAGITVAPSAPASTTVQASNGSAAVPQQPVSSTSTEPTAAAESTEGSRPRDSGRRGVSNLPAWMTKGQG